MQNSSFKIWASLGVTAISGLLAFTMLKGHSKNQRNKQDQFKPVWCLLGDVGGTNIRLELSLVKPPLNQPIVTNKKNNLRVADFDSLEAAIFSFLSDVEKKLYPQLAVIGIAGAVRGNLVQMANVPKWGQFNAQQIATSLSIRQVVFMNDFVLNSYGLQLVDQDHLVSVNGLHIDKKKLRGVVGPGTGLGTSTLFPAPFRNRQRIYVIAAEGGHVDCTYVDEQTEAFQKFMKQQKKINHLRLQDLICGPAIPYIYKFVSQTEQLLTSEAIIEKIKATDPQHLENTPQGKFLKLFLRLYGNAIGNFISVHMCSGGVYLVGSITNALIPYLQGKQDFIDEFINRHPQISSTLKRVPIVISKEINLGLKGAFYYARRLVSDEQYPILHKD